MHMIAGGRGAQFEHKSFSDSELVSVYTGRKRDWVNSFRHLTSSRELSGN